MRTKVIIILIVISTLITGCLPNQTGGTIDNLPECISAISNYDTNTSKAFEWCCQDNHFEGCKEWKHQKGSLQEEKE